MLNDINREAVAIDIDTSIAGSRLIRLFSRLEAERGLPATLRTGNGPEFLGAEFTDWRKANGMAIQSIQPGKPNQNSFSERFNRTYREGVLDLYLFEDLDQVRDETHRWLQRYNESWPRNSRGDLNSLEYAKRARASTSEMSPRRASLRPRVARMRIEIRRHVFSSVSFSLRIRISLGSDSRITLIYASIDVEGHSHGRIPDRAGSSWKFWRAPRYSSGPHRSYAMMEKRAGLDFCRLLVIEDNHERTERFRDWVPAPFRATFVRSAGRALKVLELDAGRVYAGILLDHDLDQAVAEESERNLTGRQVVERLVRTVDRDVPVLIHSVNPLGARTMEQSLVDYGFHVTRVPFFNLNRERLGRWLEFVREEWEAGD